jgi:hypothetical protein
MKLFKGYGKRVAAVAAVVSCSSLIFVAPASAAFTNYSSGSFYPADATANAATTTYNFTLGGASASVARCVKIQFGSTTSFGGHVAGLAFNTSVVTLGAQSFGTGTYSVDTLTATNATGHASSTTLSVTNVHNPTAAGNLYAKITTYGDQACTTPGQDLNTGVFGTAITDNTVVSVTVDPSFQFVVANKGTACNDDVNYVGGAGTATAVALGSITATGNAGNKSGGQTLTVDGNAGNGYSIYMRHSAAMAKVSGPAHVWDPASGAYPTGAALDTAERFGYTFEDGNNTGTRTTANNPAAAFYMATSATDQLVADGNATTPTGGGCVSFVAQTDSGTPAGSYTATIVYTAVPAY